MMEYVCTHPDTVLLAEEKFAVTKLVKPVCVKCRGSNFSYNPDSKLWECEDCGEKYLDEEFFKKCCKDYLICKKCGKKLLQKEDYPWVYYCPKCGIVVHPELDNLDEYANIEYQYRRISDDDIVFPDEEVVILRLYKCPIYNLQIRTDSVFCKHNCGWREVKYDKE